MQRVVNGLTERQQDAAALKALLDAEREQREKSDAALTQCLEQLRTELREQKQSAASASTAASDPRSSSSVAAVVVGSLGWNASADILIERAKAVLMEALPDVHASLPLVPIINQKGEGSAIETLLPVALVPEARVRVKALCRSLTGAKGIGWLDHRRSLRDAASARMIHKLFDAVAELEEQRADAHTIAKKVPARQLWTQNWQRVGWLHGLRVRWSPWAVSWYQAVDMESAASFAEGS